MSGIIKHPLPLGDRVKEITVGMVVEYLDVMKRSICYGFIAHVVSEGLYVVVDTPQDLFGFDYWSAHTGDSFEYVVDEQIVTIIE